MRQKVASSATWIGPKAALGLSPWQGVRQLARMWHFLMRFGTRCLAVALALAILGLGVGFFSFLGTLDRYEIEPPGAADGIVALTGGSQRIGDAVELLARGRGRRLLITGVNERTSRDEIARFNPEAQRLFRCCVDLDYRARNTVGNAVEIRRWAHQHDFQSLIVVTSNYHMPRTLVELAKVLPQARIVPHAVVTDQLNPDHWWFEPTTARLLMSEYAKYVVAVLRARIGGDPETSHVAALTGGREPASVRATSLAR
jgi:uncharacterized SAM-binding protein YcdF (DUF218 family)